MKINQNYNNKVREIYGPRYLKHALSLSLRKQLLPLVF